MDSHRTCLVIADDQDIRGLLSLVQAGIGFDIHTATAGKAGIQTARTLDPDPITLDVGLQDITGYNVAANLRGLSAAPIVMITGWAEAEDELQAMASGARAYLRKPFRPSQLGKLTCRLCPLDTLQNSGTQPHGVDNSQGKL
ncbi:response regulator [Arthrobacter sp. UYCu712]|uniref:response regulator transcription factor n=1 Tax=Arthrobacter sp. UYCu712 TaxID=3156340 RepID=UPI0033934D1E